MTKSTTTKPINSLPLLYMPDAQQVHPQLWIGGDTHYNVFVEAAQFRGIEALGINAIIDVRLEHNGAEEAHEHIPGVAYHWVPTDDHGGKLKRSWWADVIAAAKPHIDAGETILVHCHMGVNRGPSAGFAIMTELLGIPMIEAYDTIKAKRSVAHVIYADQWAEIANDSAQSEAFIDYFDEHQDWDALTKTIGAIRKSEWSGGYRIPLEIIQQ